MFRLSTKALVASALLMASSVALAADETPGLEVKGKLWAQYKYDLTDGSVHRNGLDIYRAYLQTSYKFDETWATTLLLDGVREATGATANHAYLMDYVRNAFVQANNIVGPHSAFRFGLQPTLYIPTIDNAAKNRWLGRSLLDEAGIFTSQSGGISLVGDIGDPMFRYGLIIHNGTEGLAGLGNADNALAGGVMLQFSPFAAQDDDLKTLTLTVYDEIQGAGLTTVGAGLLVIPKTISTTGSNTFVVAASGQTTYVDFALEFADSSVSQTAITQVGYGGNANVKLIAEGRGSIYGRYFTGNDAIKTKLGAKSVLTVGPAYAFIKDKVQTAVLFETRPAILAGGVANSQILWDWAMNF